MPLACSPHPPIMPASFLHALPGLAGAWGEIWHGGALELSAFDRLAATACRPGGQKLCRSAIRRSERAGGGPPPARSAQCLQTRRRWGAPLAASLCAASLAVRESSTLHGGLIVETPNLGTTYRTGTRSRSFPAVRCRTLFTRAARSGCGDSDNQAVLLRRIRHGKEEKRGA